MRLGSRRFSLIAVGLVAVLIAAACGSSGDDSDTDNGGSAPAPAAQQSEPAPAPTAQQSEPSSAPATTAAPGTGLINGLPEFDFALAGTNGYWYSRYTLGSLTMMSGLGLTFAPPPEAIMGMVAAVDQGPADGEHVMVPQNPALLRAVFAGGDPQFINTFNGEPGDLQNFRWDPALADITLTPSAQAQTIIKELEWAKFFNNPGWTGPVNNDFGAMDRFKGMVMYALATNQVQFALDNLRTDAGLFVAAARPTEDGVEITDASIHPAGQTQMLQALADLQLQLQRADQFNGVYANPELLATITGVTQSLFQSVRSLEPANLQDLGLAAQAAAWYAAAAETGAQQQAALAWLADLGDQLLTAPREGVIDRARAVRGLFEAHRLLGGDRYRDGAITDLTLLLNAYQPEQGTFDGLSTIPDWEVGDILGALNTSLVNGGTGVDRPRVQQTYAGFFEATINIGGLLRAVIPKELEASPFELARFPSDLQFGYPTIPPLRAAGGPNGTAAVHAGALTFDADAGRWRVSDSRFDTAGAMHTSNEMFWTFGLVSGFPGVDPGVVANLLTLAERP